MTGGLELQDISAAHGALLAALHAEGFPKPWPAEAFVKLLEDSHRHGALCLADGTPAGFIMLQQTPEEAEVITLVVAANQRRRGAGRALLRWSIADSARRGAKRIVLEVSEHNSAARSLYGALGFSEIGQRSGYYARSGGPETALVLARSVVPVRSSR